MLEGILITCSVKAAGWRTCDYGCSRYCIIRKVSAGREEKKKKFTEDSYLSSGVCSSAVFNPPVFYPLDNKKKKKRSRLYFYIHQCCRPSLPYHKINLIHLNRQNRFNLAPLVFLGNLVHWFSVFYAQTAPIPEIITSCTDRSQNLRKDTKRKFKNIIKMILTKWIKDKVHFDILNVCRLYCILVVK